MAFVSVQNVSKAYGERVVLAGACLDVEKGETVAVLGPSGSGKSTLLAIIGGLLTPDEGEVLVDGQDVTALSPSALTQYRARTVGFVFQDHHLLPQLTLLENVLLPLLALGAECDEARGMAMLERVGLADRGHIYPWQASGGERQRAALARALIHGPRLLLCDEPTGNLDQKTGAEVVALLLDTAAERQTDGSGMAVLMVTHNVTQAARFRRRVHLEDGMLREDG